MTKKTIVWIFLGVLLALLIVLGSFLIRNARSDAPPMIENTDFTGETEPKPSESETVSASLPEESSSEEIPSESSEATQPTEPVQDTTEKPSSQQPADDITKPTAPPTTPPTSDQDEDLQARIDALVAEVYALRDYYMAQLEYLEDSARAEFEALPPNERTPEKKQDIALDCIDRAYALENECDSRMDAICSELGYLLLKTDGDMSLISDIRYAYASEKEKAKNQFLEKYADYFG